MTSPSRPSSSLPALLVALPPVVLVVVAAVVLLSGAVGLDSQWRETTLNTPAAIAVHDWAQGVRRIEAGEDPNKADVVPGGNSSEPSRMMTPLEAAVREDELALVTVVLDRGATADRAERLRLACLAVSREAEEIAERLLGATPGADECAHVDLDAGVIRK